MNLRNYTKEDIVKMLHEINNDCEDCLSMYIKGCLNKDEHMSFCAKENWFNKLTPIQQAISCLLDYFEDEEIPITELSKEESK